MDVDNKIRSSTSKITVVHQDWLKRGYAPADNGKVVCPALGLGSDQVIYTIPKDNVQPHCDKSNQNQIKSTLFHQGSHVSSEELVSM